MANVTRPGVVVMETVAVRDLSGEVITRAAAQGQTLGVTNRGSLSGVLLPLTRRVLERLARRDAGDIGKGVQQAEQEMASGERLTTLSELDDGSAESSSSVTSFSRVTIRGLTGKRLAQAASDGKAVIVTSDGVSVALLIPVTANWVERLVEGGINRFLDGDASAPPILDVQAERVIPGPVPQIATDAAGITEFIATAPTAKARAPWAITGSPSGGIVSSAHDFLQSVAIGIQITSDTASNKRLVGVVTDMLAKPEAGPRERSLESTEEIHVLAQLLDLINELRSLIDKDQQLVGVGMEIGGHVHNGRVIYSPNAQWSQFPLAGRLSSLIHAPVVLENDANALAIYERRFTGIEDHSFAVIVLTEVGVGCGLMLDGEIYHGVRGMAGEFGHIPVALGDRGEDSTCRCANPGCLETAATPYAIELRLREFNFAGTYEDALQSPISESARRAFGEAGASFGRAIVTVINLINPSAIIFYGLPELLGPPRTFHVEAKPAAHGGSDLGATTAARIYTDSMVEAIRANAFSTGVYEDCRFIVRNPADQYGARAAAACLIDRFALTPLDSAIKP